MHSINFGEKSGTSSAGYGLTLSRARAALYDDEQKAAPGEKISAAGWAGGAPVARQAGKGKAGLHLARLAMSRIDAMKRGSPDIVTAAARLFGRDSEAEAIARSATGVADTETANWAAELVGSETVAMLDQDLQQLSVWAQLAAYGALVGFDDAMSVRVAQLEVDPDAGGAWVGENGAIPLIAGGVSAVRLERHKLGGIVPLTMELNATSDPLALEVMRRLLLRYSANLLDRSLLDASPAVPGVRPAGLLFGVVPIPGAAGAGLPAVSADIRAALGAMHAANVGDAVVLIGNPATLAALALMSPGLTLPAIGSRLVAPDVLILVDAACFASAADPVDLMTARDATLVMADADGVAPTHAGAAVGGGALGTAGQVIPDGGIPVVGGAGASVVGAEVRSLFQTAALALRMVWPASFAITKPGAVQVVSGITW